MDTPAEVPKDHAEHQDDTEIAKNQKIKEDLFEGDVVLTLDQAKGLLDGADTNLEHPGTGQKTKRKVVKDAGERWPGNVVYYTYEEGLGMNEGRGLTYQCKRKAFQTRTRSTSLKPP